jgi:hypothetical protein
MQMIGKCSLTRAIRLVVATSSEKVKFIFYKCVNVKYSMTVETENCGKSKKKRFTINLKQLPTIT